MRKNNRLYPFQEMATKKKKLSKNKTIKPRVHQWFNRAVVVLALWGALPIWLAEWLVGANAPAIIDEVTPVNSILLLKYLQAGHQYGTAAGRVDIHFCRESLGIADPEKAVVDLQHQGHQVMIDGNGNIHLAQRRIR